MVLGLTLDISCLSITVMLSGRPLVLTTLLSIVVKLSWPNPNLSEFITLDAALSLTGSLGIGTILYRNNNYTNPVVPTVYCLVDSYLHMGGFIGLELVRLWFLRFCILN